jgi:hypothetical protein
MGSHYDQVAAVLFCGFNNRVTYLHSTDEGEGRGRRRRVSHWHAANRTDGGNSCRRQSRSRFRPPFRHFGEQLAWAIADDFDLAAIYLSCVTIDGENLAFLDRLASPDACAPGWVDGKSITADDANFSQLAGDDGGMGGAGSLGSNECCRLG